MDWFPGGTAVSVVAVYDWPAVDGHLGGSPHLHTASAEGYVVLGGSGTLETLSSAGYAERPLAEGTVLWFTPGTVHRLVNGDGKLRILVVMQNAGLPEAGDAVFTFPPEILADASAYAEKKVMETRARRDLALAGYLELRSAVQERGPEALDPLYAAAARLVGDRTEEWRKLWRERVLDQAQRTDEQLTALAAGKYDHLRRSTVNDARPAEPRNGMCGRLSVWEFGRPTP
ncbi:cupin domain-containing protein [Hamadaea tsunoensis]|uniref:cupin domain-containing protein n=1 Tax=Hamadaea tsunoensis TaxID=53368 RepID=UPI0004110164|nr:cupin domain-containing protein [Hamadaea tsunoensis]